MKEEDYCTLFFEGWWQHCCKAHDNAYEMQVDKAVADSNLFECVYESGEGWMAVPAFLIGALMYTAVRIFGKRFYKKAGI